MIFEGITGHFEIKKRLEKAVKDELVSHAYIFAGKRGIGKKTVALAFANALTGKSRADVTVVSNELYDTGVKSDAVSVKAVRGAAADMYKKPYAAEKRVFIFPDAEKMTTQAQNALLKVFEEPPPYCVIILVTQNDSMLLQTIRSRAVTLRFGPLSDEEVENYLKENNLNCSSVAVRLASGSIGMACVLCGDEDLRGVLDSFADMFKKIGSGKAKDIYGLIHYIQNEKKNVEVLFDVMLIMLRDTMLGNETELKIDGVGRKKAAGIVSLVENTRKSLSFNANIDLAVSEMMLDILGVIND